MTFSFQFTQVTPPPLPGAFASPITGLQSSPGSTFYPYADGSYRNVKVLPGCIDTISPTLECRRSRTVDGGANAVVIELNRRILIDVAYFGGDVQANSARRFEITGPLVFFFNKFFYGNADGG